MATVKPFKDIRQPKDLVEQVESQQIPGAGNAD